MTTTPEVLLETYGYKIVTWTEFQKADDIPKGLHAKVEELCNNLNGQANEFVIYDPTEDHEGYLAIGENRETLVDQALEDLNLR